MQDLSYYPETLKDVGLLVKASSLDHQAFNQKVKVCELPRCKATCCYDGVYVSAEEERKLLSLVKDMEPKGVWKNYGLASCTGEDLTHQNIFNKLPKGQAKTAVREAKKGELAHDFPAHFNNTRCVFLDNLGRCGLQRLAIDEGRHPWYYKPQTCWIHPLSLTPSEQHQGRTTLTLYTTENDPQKDENYPGFGSYTPCGKADLGGIPAKQALSAELAQLGKIGERDLLGELNAPEI